MLYYKESTLGDMHMQEAIHKRKLANSLSALVLLSFAVIWLVYLCAGNQMDAGVAQRLSLSISILSLATYIVKLAFTYKVMPKWLIILMTLAMFGTIPATVVDVFKSCNIDLTIFPLVKDLFYVSQKVTHIILYVVLITNAYHLTDSWIFRILFIVIGSFLIFCVVVEWLPFLASHFPVPLIGFEPIL